MCASCRPSFQSTVENNVVEDDGFSEDEKDLFNTLFTPEEIGEIKAKGPVGFWEALSSKPREMIPFWATLEQGYEAASLLNLSERAKKGDNEALQELYAKMREDAEKQIRGTDIFGTMGNILHQAPAFMGEFAAAVATLGTTTAPTVAAKTAASLGTKAATAAAKAGIKSAVVKKGVEGLARSAVVAAAMPQQAAKSYLDRKVAGTVRLTDKGEVLLSDAEEAPAMTALKAMGDAWVGVASEMSGEAIMEAAGKAVSPVLNGFRRSKGGQFVGQQVDKLTEMVSSKISVKVKDEFFRLVKKVKPDADISKMLKDRLYFNGVLGEVGEERLEDVMRVALGLNDEDKGTLDKYMDALFPSPSEFAAEIGAFTMIGGMSRAGGRVYKGLLAKGLDKAQALQAVNQMTESQKDEAAEKFGVSEYYPTLEVPVDQISLSQDIPQFKEGANESGIVEGQQLEGKYDRLGTPPVMLFRRKDGGRLEVISGRHRLDLARRNGEATIPAQIVDEDETHDVQWAKMFDVLSNIKDEKGTTKDFLRVFENTPDFSIEDARENGILAQNRKGIGAWNLSRLGTEPVKSAFLNDRITEKKAVAIVEGAPNNEAAQAAGLAKAKDMSADELKFFVHGLTQAEAPSVTGEQGSLFGFDDSFVVEQEKMAKAAAKEKENIQAKIRAVKGALKNPEAAEEMGLKFEATPENIQAEVERLQGEIDALETFYTNPELMKYFRDKINGKETGPIESVLYETEDVEEQAPEANPNQGALFAMNVKAEERDNTVSIKNFDKSSPSNAFVMNRNGNISHGIISEEIAEEAGIYPGEIRVYNELYEHLSRVKPNEKTSRLDQIKKLGYENPIDFIDDVMENLLKIQEGSNGSLLLTGNIGKNNTVAIRLEREKGFYKVTTLMPRRKTDNKKTVWEAALPLQNKSEQPAIIGPSGSINIAPKTEESKKNKTAFYEMPVSAYNANEPATSEQSIANIADAAERASRPFMDREESKKDLLTRRWKDVLNPIKKFGEAIYRQARLFAGVGGKVEMMLRDKTRNLNDEETGEGLKPIIIDFKTEFGVKQKTAEEDLGSYMIAKRYLEDLEGREDVLVTKEQISESIDTMTRLQNKYGENLIRFDQYAERIYDYQARVLHLLVESGLKSQEWYDRTLKENPHYIPLKRILPKDMESVNPQRNARGRGVGGGWNPIKRLKGSALEERNVFSSIVNNTADIITNAFRNDTTRKIANLRKTFPELIREVLPQRASYDKGLREQIKKGIELLGGKYSRTKKRLSKDGGRYGAFGVYMPAEKEIKESIGSDAALVHEFGHMLDFELGLGEAVLKGDKDGEIREELEALARERLGTKLIMEDGRFKNEQNYPKGKGAEYLYSKEELIANLFDAYVNTPELLDEYAPTAKKRVQEFIENSPHQWLKDIHRTLDVGFETLDGRLDSAKNVVSYRQNGQKRYIEVHEDLYQALKGSDNLSIDTVSKISRKFASMLRWGATQANLTFAVVRNPFRDTMTAWMQTDVGFKPVIDTIRGAFHVLTNSETYREWKASGGSFDSFMQINENSKKNPYEELFTGRVSFTDIINPFHWVEKIGGVMEEGTRTGVYLKARQKGLSMQEAGLVSRDATLDFARGGSEARKWNNHIPFFNANLQGAFAQWDRFQQDKVGFLFRGLLRLTLPSLALSGFYMYFADDDEKEEYKQIPQWQKDLFWNLKINGQWVTIPKPAGYGQLFASLPQAFAEGTLSGDDTDWAEVTKDVVGNFFPLTDVATALPIPARIALELTANYQFYFNKDIVPMYLTKVLPEDQYTDRTSELLKQVGQKTGLSPIKMEYLSNTLLGGISKDMLALYDMGVKKDAPKKESGDIPVLRGLIARDPTGWNSKSVQEFSDMFAKLSEVKASMNLNMKRGSDQAEEFMRKHEKEIELYEAAAPYSETIKALSKELNETVSDENLSPEAKTERMKSLRKEMTDTAREALKTLKERR